MPSRLSQEIAPELPYLRRYARALTGSQQSGDAHVTACLDALVADPAILSLDDGARVGLYRLFHDLWAGLRLDPPPGADDNRPEAERTAQQRLAAMPPEGRQVLLLTALEGFTRAETARITGHDEAEIGRLLAEALDDLREVERDQRLVLDDQHFGHGLPVDLGDRLGQQPADLRLVVPGDPGRLGAGEPLERGQQ
ncbi:MAG TPA: sigma factor-like helix-turn-helix DNA-binding protein, partial [Amaricoccus sp.]|nr:sigma factor-like helix-turn-helix DNA-binding protein [Amaricoccus sp.]